MRKTTLAVIAIAAMAASGLAAGAAQAAEGQCFDRAGNPIGPTYDTDHPDYNFLDWVNRRGGRCTGQVTPNRNYRRGYPDGYRNNNHFRILEREQWRQDRGYRR